VKLPIDLLAHHFRTSSTRGTVIKFLMTDPDDPRIESRPKYALLVGIESEGPESLLLLATSKLDKLNAFRTRLPRGFHDLAVGAYEWVKLPTTLDLRKVKCYPREDLIAKMNEGVLTFEGRLSDEEMTEIDKKLRLSQTIEVKTLRKIVSGA
jgi:hypothetical protein